jgi:hypothetical protein
MVYILLARREKLPYYNSIHEEVSGSVLKEIYICLPPVSMLING